MTSIIWSLLVIACTEDGMCLTQTIQWFDSEPECLEFKALHESIPPDGDWKTVNYSCQIVGAIGT